MTSCRSEGIQVGSVASAMGVIGTWTGESHTEHDPVGKYFRLGWYLRSFTLWKVHFGYGK